MEYIIHPSDDDLDIIASDLANAITCISSFFVFFFTLFVSSLARAEYLEWLLFFCPAKVDHIVGHVRHRRLVACRLDNSAPHVAPRYS